jgi:predicted short-subunit dehydrogenase-like oxidoreductase (DUF2520 family)
MDIVLIGTGNTATILGKKLKAAGHRIVQVFGRDSSEASALAYDLGTESTNYWNVVTRDAHIYVIAVSDIAVEEVKRELRFSNQIIVHTAASVAKDVLKGASNHYGVFYPLQSLKKGTSHLPETPILIDASDEATLKELDVLAHSITEQVSEANDTERLKLHLAAVFCNNFVNHLYALTESYCKKEGIDFRLLLPLIRETAGRLDTLSPSQVQTGPALRGDQVTLNRHMELLKNHPEMLHIYKALSESITAQRH